jgi:hypothetical protein
MILSDGDSTGCDFDDLTKARGALPLAGGASEAIDVWLRAWFHSANTLKRSFELSPPRCATQYFYSRKNREFE